MQKQSRSGCFKTKLRPDSRLDPKKLKRVSVLLKARIQAQSSVGNFEKLKRYRAHSVSEGRFHFNRDKEKPEVFRDRKRPIRVFVSVSDHFPETIKCFGVFVSSKSSTTSTLEKLIFSLRSPPLSQIHHLWLLLELYDCF